MSILDRVHGTGMYVGDPSLPVTAPDLDPDERIRLTLAARTAALDAVARMHAAGRTGGPPLLDRAESFERWILRDEVDETVDTHTVPQDMAAAVRDLFRAADGGAAVADSYLRAAIETLYEVVERHDPRRQP